MKAGLYCILTEGKVLNIKSRSMAHTLCTPFPLISDLVFRRKESEASRGQARHGRFQVVFLPTAGSGRRKITSIVVSIEDTVLDP